jgi:predicted  nucleic acid-binding Zn-ribbon protein
MASTMQGRLTPAANFGPKFFISGVITMSKRDIYVDKMKLQLSELNAQMDRAELRAKEAREDLRDKYKEEMAKLHAQSRLALAKLEEVQKAGETTWEAMVAEMDKIRDAFTHSFSYFKSQVK